MPGEAVFLDICPICDGKGKVENVLFKRSKAAGENIKCEVCNGTGKIVIVKKFRKRGK